MAPVCVIAGVPGNLSLGQREACVTRPPHARRGGELGSRVWAFRGVLVLKSPWEVRWENMLEQGRLFTE